MLFVMPLGIILQRYRWNAILCDIMNIFMHVIFNDCVGLGFVGSREDVCCVVPEATK